MTRRRAFTTPAASSWLAWPLGLAAQPAALRKALQALGYAEGKDLVFERRWGEVRNERLPALAAELVALRLDVLVTMGGPSAAAAKQATLSTPVVVINAGDVVETGLVASLSRPGGNVTGLNDPATELSAKRLEMIKELVPATQRVAQLLRVRVEPLGVREPDDFGSALAAMTRTRPDALTTLNRQKVVDFAAAQRIPAMYEVAATVRGGGLMSYGGDMDKSFALVARYVDRILKGAKPAELPVEQPNRYLLTINRKTAKTLGLTIPPALLARVDEVVE